MLPVVLIVVKLQLPNLLLFLLYLIMSMNLVLELTMGRLRCLLLEVLLLPIILIAGPLVGTLLLKLVLRQEPMPLLSRMIIAALP